MLIKVSMLLYIFGLDASTDKINYKYKNSNTNIVDNLGNIIIYDPEYNPNTHRYIKLYISL
jgi:hypothetical protein